jgi:hypothetical protein
MDMTSSGRRNWKADAVRDGLNAIRPTDCKPGRNLLGHCLDPLVDVVRAEQLKLKASQGLMSGFRDRLDKGFFVRTCDFKGWHFVIHEIFLGLKAGQFADKCKRRPVSRLLHL